MCIRDSVAGEGVGLFLALDVRHPDLVADFVVLVAEMQAADQVDVLFRDRDLARREALRQIAVVVVEPDDIDRVEAGLLYTSDAADDLLCVDSGGRRIIKNTTVSQYPCGWPPHHSASHSSPS